MGRPPKPKQLKIAEGNRSKVGMGQLHDEPQGRGRPRIPPGFTPDQIEMWLDVIGSLPDGLLSRADESALETFVWNWDTVRQARLEIDRTGLLIKTPEGYVRNPLLVVLNNAAKLMASYGGQLGLTPVARAKLAHPTKWDDDPLEMLINGDDYTPPRKKAKAGGEDDASE